LYAVRRWLGFSVDEWCALPWWQQRLYIGELDRDQPWKQPAPAAAAAASVERGQAPAITVPPNIANIANPQVLHAANAVTADPYTADLGSFAQLGMRTRRAAPSGKGG
jgi:hypothetical protein